jgi:hypothetical protein
MREVKIAYDSNENIAMETNITFHRILRINKKTPKTKTSEIVATLTTNFGVIFLL